MRKLKQLRGRPRVVSLAVAVALVVAAGAGWALAATRSSGVIHACANKKTGALRLAGKSGKCKRGERAVSWNVQGVAGKNGTSGTNGTNGTPGTPGTPGTAGINGTNGTNGTNGATSVVVRVGSAVSTPDATTGIASASCNAGERATGGGVTFTGSDSGWKLAEDFPTPGTNGSTPTGWSARAVNTTGSTQNLFAIVVCASP